MNQTSSIKIFEERNTTYTLGEELRFLIPKSVLAINAMQTYICANIEVKTNLKSSLSILINKSASSQ